MRSVYETTTEIRVGDTVSVLSGKDAGKRGSVERLVAPGKVVVTGLNIAKKHQKPRQKMASGSQAPTVEPGGIIEVAMPVCPKCDRPIRLKAGRTADGKKQRLCGRCGTVIGGKKEAAK